MNAPVFRPEPLSPRLRRHIVTMPSGVRVLRHPYVTGLYAEELHAMFNARLEHVTTEVQAALQRRDLEGFVFLHERPFRLTALLEYVGTVGANSIHADALAEATINVWVDCEGPSVNRAAWAHLFRVYVAPSHIGAEAKATVPALLYRGAVAERNVGMSWTPDLELAQWFARRNGMFAKRKPVTYQVAARPDDVLARCDQREPEFILDPRSLRTNPTVQRLASPAANGPFETHTNGDTR